jgi:hypothetical protein
LCETFTCAHCSEAKVVVSTSHSRLLLSNSKHKNTSLK